MRNSNIELCRILSMVMVILLHSSYSTFGWPTILNLSTLALSLIESFSIIAVNVFVLITGYFSTSLKKKSVFNFCFIVLFYGLIRILYQLFDGGFHITSLFVFTNQNWFILSYFGLILFTPILNEYISKTDKNSLRFEIIILLILEFISDFIPGIGGIFNRGCSVLSFIVIYLIGRYVRMGGAEWLHRRCGIMYIASSLLIFIGTLVILYFELPQVALYHWLYYSNPIIIFSALCFFVIFLNKVPHYNNTINYIAKSCFAVLLIHVPFEAPLWKYMQEYYIYVAEKCSLLMMVPLWLAGIIFIFLVALIVDQLRLFVWGYVENYFFNSSNINDKKNYKLNSETIS